MKHLTNGCPRWLAQPRRMVWGAYVSSSLRNRLAVATLRTLMHICTTPTPLRMWRENLHAGGLTSYDTNTTKNTTKHNKQTYSTHKAVQGVQATVMSTTAQIPTALVAEPVALASRLVVRCNRQTLRHSGFPGDPSTQY